MKSYTQIREDSEYREVYDSYIQTVDNLNDVDFLYSSMLSNGQVFFKDDYRYGTVNGQYAYRNTNITISREYIDNFRIANFILYTRATNELITLDINCNLASYRDNKVHYLYVILDQNGTYEVWDDMFQSDDTKILFARFIIGTNGDSKQFYMMLPFAGSADYIKGNQFYQVTDGLRVKVVNNNTKRLTVSKAKIRFSAINFDDKASPDCITVDHEGNAVPIRYVYWDSNSGIPRADWDSSISYDLILNKVMDYTNGRMSSVATGKFSVQKFYYDVYERCIVAMYGNASYDTRDSAIYAIDSVMSYPLPDGIEYLIPIACVVMQNTSDPISEDNFRIVNLDYNEQEVLDSDTFTRQQAAEAVTKANQAISTVSNLSTLLSNHTGNVNNPHKVRLDQLKKSDGTAGAIDDSFAESGLTVTSLTNRILNTVGDTYYKKTGGTITGAVTMNSTLDVSGKTTLANTDVNALKISGDTTFDSENRNIGTSSRRLGYLYVKNISASLTSYLAGIDISGDLKPTSNGSYYLGLSNNRWAAGYINALYANTSVTGGTGAFTNLSASGTLLVSGNITANGGTNSVNGKLVVNNGSSNDALDVTGRILARNNIQCNGNLSTSGTLTVGSSATFNAYTNFKGNQTVFDNEVYVYNNGMLHSGIYWLRLGGPGTIGGTYGYGIW